MTTFVQGAGSFDGAIPEFTINGAGIDATLVEGDIIVMGIILQGVEETSLLTAPADWTVDMQWEQVDGSNNYGVMFAHKVWTALDDQGTYTAVWTWRDINFGGTSVVVGVTDTAGIASVATGSDDGVTVTTPTDYAMPSSSDILFELAPVSTSTYPIIKLATYDFTDQALFLSQRQGGAGDEGSFVSVSSLVPSFKEPLTWNNFDIAAGYSTTVTPPPEGDIRISGNTRRYRNLSVS